MRPVGQSEAPGCHEFCPKPSFFLPRSTQKLLFSQHPQHSCISRERFTARPHLSKPTSLVCYASFCRLHLIFISSHMCISLELFMLCFVFNTTSCKSKGLPGIKHSKLLSPPTRPNRGLRIYGRVIAPETEAERSLRLSAGPSSLKPGTVSLSLG